MVGRVLVNGKDGGILITHQTPGEMRREKLRDVMAAAKSRQVRMVLVGTLEVPKRGLVNVFQTGTNGGPVQTLLIDGKPLSMVGADAPAGGGDKEMEVEAGSHLVQWICDFDGREAPRIDIYLNTGNGRVNVRTHCTRAQEYDARKRAFSTEIDLSPYGRDAK